MSGTIFPTGTTDGTPTRATRVLGDDGAQTIDFDLSAILKLIILQDFVAQLFLTLDNVEDVPAATTTYPVVAADQNKTKLFLSTSACAVNLPAGMPRGFIMPWIQGGAGTLTFASAAGAGQTIRFPASGGLRSAEQWATGALEVIRTNEWLLTGGTMA